MLQSVDAAKTHEIMARFRPIAPKPQLPPSSRQCLDSPSAALLRARPCRARKRGRAVCLVPPAPNKRPKALLPAPPPHVGPHVGRLNGTGRLSAPQGFARGPPLLPPHPARAPALPAPPPPAVIAPVPVRPVGSSISVGCISRAPAAGSDPLVSRRAEEVEEEVESEAEPAVVSDWNNRVRLANSAYKEMVGQPECPWLETMASAASRRINGEVVLDLPEPWEIPAGAGGGFSCRVRIAWACSGGRRGFVDAPCDVTRLHCDSMDYKFAWRIHTGTDAGGF